MALRMALLSAALLASASVALAQTTGPGFTAAQPAGAATGWTKFTEPSEGAYTVEVPQGWQAAGGVRRYAASEAPVWLTVESPDHSTELFLGDPSLAPFFLPGQYSPEGSQMPGVHGRAATVMRYRPGAEYASLYGTRSLASVCSNVQPQGTQPVPALESEMRQHVQSATRLDAGEARFSCERNGQRLDAAVQAGTALQMFPGGNGAGFWAVLAIRGYLAPAGQGAQAAQLLDHITASFTPAPQFLAGLQQANAAEEEIARRQAQQPPPAPSPLPTPIPAPVPRPSPQASACPGDLQQQRICNINDGHLVVSGGCLRCISP